MNYNLTFDEMVNNIFSTNGWYQGNDFADGYFLKLVDNIIQVWYFDNKIYDVHYHCDFHISGGTFRQKYRRVFVKEDVMRKVK